jgi:hypothetical protein
MRVIAGFFILLLAAIAPSIALASVGEAVGVIPEANLDSSGIVTVLHVGADVEIGETVKTGPVGQVELIFTDGTKLVVGPGSSLIIEDYLVRSGGGVGKLAINALGGTFRFFTGSMAKPSYEIQTPSGTIGVRGTIFELYVNKFGNALVTVLEGAVNLCVQGSANCEAVSIETSQTCGAAFLALNANGFQNLSATELANYFPYLENQEPLSEPFRVGWAADCFKDLVVGTAALEEPVPVRTQ